MIYFNFEFQTQINKPKITSKQLYGEYNNGLDSINLVTSIENLKLKVEYLLSQDPKYQKAQNKTPNKDNSEGNRQLDLANLKPRANLINNLEIPQLNPQLQLPQQKLASPLEIFNAPNPKLMKEEEEKVEKLVMKKGEDRRFLYTSPYDYH